MNTDGIVESADRSTKDTCWQSSSEISDLKV